jgi:methanogenic corrinoid protein MtbC1
LTAEVFSEFLTLKGWTVFYTGRSAPAKDLVESVVRSRPDIVFLSVSLVRNLPAAKALLIQLRKEAPGAKIILSGQAARTAGKTLTPWVDAVAQDIRSAYSKALEFVTQHAPPGLS